MRLCGMCMSFFFFFFPCALLLRTFSRSVWFRAESFLAKGGAQLMICKKGILWKASVFPLLIWGFATWTSIDAENLMAFFFFWTSLPYNMGKKSTFSCNPLQFYMMSGRFLKISLYILVKIIHTPPRHIYIYIYQFCIGMHFKPILRGRKVNLKYFKNF